jgi:hypothetical protein
MGMAFFIFMLATRTIPTAILFTNIELRNSGKEAQVKGQIGSSLKKLGLEPSQIRRIQSLMDLTLLDLVDVETPVHIKISVSGVDLKKYVAVNAESAEELQSSKSGLGVFFWSRGLFNNFNHLPNQVITWWKG